jgi:DNA replication and repair protein RecF
MLIRLKLTHFKNYAQQTLVLSPRLNCLTGLNGMGKTNVLDAVHFLCLLKSHRGLPDRSLVQHEADFFRLEGQFGREGVQHKIVVKYPLGQRKEIERNDVPVPRLTDHVGQFPVVMIAPEDIALVLEGSEERRRLLDVTLSQIHPEYLSNLLIYNALLKQRNALLKQFGEQRRFDATLLEAIDRQLPAPAWLLTQYRRDMVAAMRPIFADIYARIAEGREVAELTYESNWTGASAAEFGEALAAQVERDRHLERTSVGPHRDDLNLLLDGHPVKKFASQGQLKSFLLAIRLAQYELLRQQLGNNPILLLDDIFDKLDPQRVRHLVAVLLEKNVGQIFITDTQRERLEGVIASFSDDYKFFEIENGQVTSSSEV